MKYYKDENNQVYAYEADGSQDAFIKPSLVAITEQEKDTILNPPETSSAAATRVRAARDRLLAETDWTQVLDAPVDQKAWAEYRQALRDLPKQADFPIGAVYPTKPN